MQRPDFVIRLPLPTHFSATTGSSMVIRRRVTPKRIAKRADENSFFDFIVKSRRT
jgi:hypothetical protein